MLYCNIAVCPPVFSDQTKSHSRASGSLRTEWRNTFQSERKLASEFLALVMLFAQVCFYRFNQEEALNCVQIGTDFVPLRYSELSSKLSFSPVGKASSRPEQDNSSSIIHGLLQRADIWDQWRADLMFWQRSTGHSNRTSSTEAVPCLLI